MKAAATGLPRMLRHLGDAFGVVLVLAFVAGALACWSQYGRHMTIAGRPAISPETLHVLLADGALLRRVPHWIAAWAWLVAAGGCAVLAVAGVRWAVVRARDILAAHGR